MTFIVLPHGKGNTLDRPHDDGFWIDSLIRKLQATDGNGMRLGKDRQTTYDNHRYTDGLDYWLRSNFVKSPGTFQLSNDVVENILASGLFEIRQEVSGKSGKNPEWIYLLDRP